MRQLTVTRKNGKIEVLTILDDYEMVPKAGGRGKLYYSTEAGTSLSLTGNSVQSAKIEPIQ